MDVVATFLAECCRTSKDAFVSSKDMYAAYSQWCMESGERALPLREFHTALVERGIVPGRTRSERGWRGLELVTDDRS